jgi:hypothetical protein
LLATSKLIGSVVDARWRVAENDGLGKYRRGSNGSEALVRAPWGYATDAGLKASGREKRRVFAGRTVGENIVADVVSLL